MARQRRDLQEHQLTIAGDSPLEADNDDIDAGQISHTCTSPLSPAPPPTSDSMVLPPTDDHDQSRNTTTTTTLPPTSQRHASLTSLDSRSLLSSSAPVQIVNQGHQYHRGGGLGAKLRLSGAHRLSYSTTSRRYSPASSPAHSQHLPLAVSMLGSGRQSVQSGLKQIEYIRNLRQLALLAEQVSIHMYDIVIYYVPRLASSPGPLSQLFNVARKKAIVCNIKKLGERAWGRGYPGSALLIST